ncbi:DUF4097 family beta strand repeat-containing protein [Kitasatospora sp. NPDC005856]|uniref:DUF4097 family beta strand repeat-containing protein n=1 Tax=Kitasatospora sp. NPDC005856 TaxID=3154566 RepID=UPI0033D71141
MKGAKGARGWRAVGTVVIVLVMLGAGLQTWSMAVQQRTSTTRPYDLAIHRLQLETGNASVRVRAGREGRVVVRQSLDWLVRKPVVSTVFDGDVLTVGMRCRQVLPFADFGCGAEIELEVPAATEVSGSVGSGSVQVEGLSGDVRMELTSGQLLLFDTSGDVSLHATSGQVRGTNLSMRRVTAQVVSGSVQLGFAKAPREVDATATSGSVELTVPKGSRYAVSSEIGSGNGRIDPRLADPASPNRVHTAVTSGSITVVPAASEPQEQPMPPMSPMSPMSAEQTGPTGPAESSSPSMAPTPPSAP